MIVPVIEKKGKMGSNKKKIDKTSKKGLVNYGYAMEADELGESVNWVKVANKVRVEVHVNAS